MEYKTIAVANPQDYFEGAEEPASCEITEAVSVARIEELVGGGYAVIVSGGD